MDREPNEGRKTRERTCVGCGQHAGEGELLRLVVAEDEVCFDLAGGAFGRGAHLHASPACLAKAPRGLSRAFKREIRIDAATLGASLVAACDRRMTGLLLAARRSGSLSLGTDDTMSALRSGAAPLAIVAVDAGQNLTTRLEVQDAVREGRAFAWKTKSDLGVLFGRDEVAVCGVRHSGIASELKTLRAAADAGAATMREGAGCSSTYPEAR